MSKGFSDFNDDAFVTGRILEKHRLIPQSQTGSICASVWRSAPRRRRTPFPPEWESNEIHEFCCYKAGAMEIWDKAISPFPIQHKIQPLLPMLPDGELQPSDQF